MLSDWVIKIEKKINSKEAGSFCKKILESIRGKNLWNKYKSHVFNLTLIICSYLLGSLLTYSNINCSIFFRDLFSILCIYGALFCFFIEKFSENNFFRICLAATT